MVFLFDSKRYVFCAKRDQLDTKGTAGWGEGRWQCSLRKGGPSATGFFTVG
jgi:hypothetical protein